MNPVRVWGFYIEGKHRLLVYEYLVNGSLDKILFAFDAANVLDKEKRYIVVVGAVMGLAYLHEECIESSTTTWSPITVGVIAVNSIGFPLLIFDISLLSLNKLFHYLHHLIIVVYLPSYNGGDHRQSSDV